MSQPRTILLLAGVLLVVGLLLQAQSSWTGSRHASPGPFAGLDLDDIEMVEIVRRSDTLRIVREGHGWTLVEPRTSDADAATVDAMLGVWLGLGEGVPVDAAAGQPPEDYGLGQVPRARVTLTTTDGSRTTVIVGNASPVDLKTYMTDAHGRIVVVRGELDRWLSASPETFMDLRAFRFDVGDVERVEIRGPEGELGAERVDGDWWIDGLARAQRERVADLLYDLLEIRVVPSEAVSVEDLTFQVVVQMSEGGEQVLRAGRVSDEGRVVVTTPRRQGTVADGELRMLRMGAEDLGVRRALGIDLARTDRVVIDLHGVGLDARRHGAVWSSPGRSDAVTSDLVGAVADIPVAYVASPVLHPGAPWGAVSIEEGDRAWRLLISSPTAGGVQAVQDVRGAPLAVSSDALSAVVATIKASPPPD